MNRVIITAAALLSTSASAALAAGIDRTLNDYGVLYEEGSYLQFGASYVRPDVSGAYPIGLGGGSTGDMAGDYAAFSFAYKREINEKLSFGLILNQPYGADALYTGGAYNGLQAEWKSRAVTGLLKYQYNPRVSFYGGVQVSQSDAVITIPDQLIRGAFAAADPATGGPAIAAGAPAGSLEYNASTDRAITTNFILGAAYEIPEIALRVGLTYESGGTYDFTSTESIAAFGLLPGTLPLDDLGDRRFEIEVPQSLTLDFQSGIAEDTLAFGQVRYAEWSVWDVRPDGYAAATGGQSVTGIDNNSLAVQLGVGRRLNDTWSVFGQIGWERASGGLASRLSPTDGLKSIAVGASYTQDNMRVTGGLSYAELGDAIDGSGTNFSGNSAVGLGVSVGYSF